VYDPHLKSMQTIVVYDMKGKDKLKYGVLFYTLLNEIFAKHDIINL
jgi:hypothetical protein